MGSYFFWGFLSLLIVVYLYRDYARDKGLHIKAKTIHAVLVTLLFLLFLGSFRAMLNMITNFSEVIGTIHSTALFPQKILQAIVVLNGILSAFIFWHLGLMMKRKNKSRLLVTKLMPVLGITSGFNLYRLMVKDGGLLGIPEWLFLIMAFFFSLLITISAMKIYQSQFMVRFFELDLEKGDKDMNQLEELIDEVGGSESPKNEG